MAESLTSVLIAATLSGTLTNAIDGSQTASVPQGTAFTPGTSITTGTSANQADRIWGDVDRSIAASGTEDIDLYDLGTINIGAGAGLSALGQAVTLAEVVALLVTVSTSTSGTLNVGGKNAASAWNSPFAASDSAKIGPIGPGGALLLFRPDDPAWAVTDTSNHLLQMEEAGGANTVTYSIFVLGRSA